MGIFIVYALEDSFQRPPLTTGEHFRSLCNYVKFSAS
jgi:hypothetical protein